MKAKKPLSQRQCEILSGAAELPQWKVEKYRDLWIQNGYDVVQRDVGMSESKAEDRFPCIHRGEKIGEHQCKPCDGGRVHAVYVCGALSRACTIRSSSARDDQGRRALACLACDHREVLQ